jgi:predicted secreted protein
LGAAFLFLRSLFGRLASCRWRSRLHRLMAARQAADAK